MPRQHFTSNPQGNMFHECFPLFKLESMQINNKHVPFLRVEDERSLIRGNEYDNIKEYNNKLKNYKIDYRISPIQYYTPSTSENPLVKFASNIVKLGRYITSNRSHIAIHEEYVDKFITVTDIELSYDEIRRLHEDQRVSKLKLKCDVEPTQTLKGKILACIEEISIDNYNSRTNFSIFTIEEESHTQSGSWT